VLFEFTAESFIQTDQNQFGMLSMRLLAGKAPFSIEAMSAAGTPWPVTSATKMQQHVTFL
jgi:hypothetical protein